MIKAFAKYDQFKLFCLLGKLLCFNTANGDINQVYTNTTSIITSMNRNVACLGSRWPTRMWYFASRTLLDPFCM